jgi:hypothetical protein
VSAQWPHSRIENGPFGAWLARPREANACGVVNKTGQRVPADVRPMVPLLQGLLIGFFGTGLYVAVDTYEPDRTVAFVLKCLAVMWGDAAVIHCTGLFVFF